MTEPAIKVGDQLAVPRRYGRDGWDIFTVSKITPAGRIYLKVGNVVNWVLNPDLTLRGDPCHRSAEPLTSNAIKRWLRRDGILQQIRKYDLDELPTATLEAVLKTLRGET